METKDEINQRMRSAELVFKEYLMSRGEAHFMDQEFPPSNQSLFIDSKNPTAKLHVVSE